MWPKTSTFYIFRSNEHTQWSEFEAWVDKRPFHVFSTFDMDKTSVKFRNFAELYLRSLMTHRSSSNSANLLISRRSLQSADFPNICPCQKLKKPRKGLLELVSVFVHRNVGTVCLTAIILGKKGNLNDWWQTICPQTGTKTKNTIDQCYSAFYLCQRFSYIFFFLPM